MQSSQGYRIRFILRPNDLAAELWMGRMEEVQHTIFCPGGVVSRVESSPDV